VSEIIIVIIIKKFHGAFDDVRGIIAQNTQIPKRLRFALKFCWISDAVSALLYIFPEEILPVYSYPEPE
jgi:hypothetical protein